MSRRETRNPVNCGLVGLPRTRLHFTPTFRRLRPAHLALQRAVEAVKALELRAERRRVVHDQIPGRLPGNAARGVQTKAEYPWRARR
jgi:hypothetical protein